MRVEEELLQKRMKKIKSRWEISQKGWIEEQKRKQWRENTCWKSKLCIVIVINYGCCWVSSTKHILGTILFIWMHVHIKLPLVNMCDPSPSPAQPTTSKIRSVCLWHTQNKRGVSASHGIPIASHFSFRTPASGSPSAWIPKVDREKYTLTDVERKKNSKIDYC